MSGRGQLRVWLVALGAALIISLAWSPIRGGRGGGIDYESWQLLGDKKLKRIARRFAGEIPERPQLAEWNHDGIQLDVRMDPAVLEAMRIKSNREFYKEEFVDAELRFGYGPPLTSKVALRGSGSLEYSDELSFKVTLAQKEQIAPDVGARRFYLMALVEDERKVKARWASDLHAQVGLFPMYYQFVDIYLNGERQGLGMLIEPPKRAIQRLYPSTTAIYRRARKPRIYLNYWDDGSLDAEANIQALRVLNDERRLSDPVGDYERVLDVESYLVLLAASSILLNDDTHDELWLYQTLAPDGTPQPLRLSAWDLENVASAPAAELQGVDDPLMYGARGVIDQQVARYPAFHARYRATLSRLLDGELSLERISAALRAVQAQVDALEPEMAKRRARHVERKLGLLRTRNEFLRAELAKPR